MRGKRLQERQQHALDLARKELASRCQSCRKALGWSLFSHEHDGAFCNTDCWADWKERQEAAGKAPEKEFQRFGR